jgi:hypothetical protein
LSKSEAASDHEVLTWLVSTANALVNAFRPRLASFAREA